MSGPSPPLVLSVFSTFDVGGPQVRFAAIANHFGKRFRHQIVAMDGAFGCKDLLGPDLDITLLPIDNRKGDTLGNRRRFRRLLRALQPDCLVTYNWGAIEWAMANWPRVTRHIHIEDGFGPEEANRQIPRRVLTRRIVLRNSTLVVPSKQLEHVARDIWRLNGANIKYIPNGIDCARFANPRIEPLRARGKGCVFGTVAALRPEKNLVRLLEAFRLVRDQRSCSLIIAGDGSERTRLERYAVELGIAADVSFIGYRDDTERVYASMDIFALSSDTEQMPTSVLEAMAAGLPIVSTDVGDVRVMVCTENAAFIVPHSASALAQAMKTLMDDAGLRRLIGSANQVLARRAFSQDKMFAAYAQLFEGRP